MLISSPRFSAPCCGGTKANDSDNKKTINLEAGKTSKSSDAGKSEAAQQSSDDKDKDVNKDQFVLSKTVKKETEKSDAG